MKQVDLCVIGSGPGGYVAAIKAAQLGKKTLVVEKQTIGGVCLNVGCIPSKALITAAHFLDKMKSASEMGIRIPAVTVDGGQLQTWKQAIVNKLTGGISQLFKANGVESLMGEAKFISPNEVEVKTQAGVEKINAKNFIIATGSRPIEIPGFAFDKKYVLSSTEALEISQFNQRVVVIGGGYIGLEIGSFLAKLGTDVTVLEANKAILTGVTDPDCAQVVSRKLKKKNVKLLTEAKAIGFKKQGSDLAVQVQVNGTDQTVLCDKILVTVGRRPNSENLGLEKAGVKTDSKGFIPVNSQMRTNVNHIFAIGDVAGQPMLAHKASREGIVAAEVIAGKNSAMDVKTIPAVVFTDPEIASSGMTEEEAKLKGYETKSGTFPYVANGRALSMMDSDGFIKVIVDKKTDIVLGVHIVGYEASNLISEAALAIEMGATAEDIARTIHPHPTLGEMMMEAAEATTGHAIHIVVKPPRDREPRASART
ncbi:MAG: dihydrolipoyl dehydrogenase [Oligoflexia bacterium]|nr:dihydrolipoyl dehydrogenase [Oligoflexia bacterium]